jgi:hypothetical protein
VKALVAAHAAAEQFLVGYRGMFDDWPRARDPVFRPAELAAEIDALNDEIYPAKSTRPSTTASIARALRRHRRHMRKRSIVCLRC